MVRGDLVRRQLARRFVKDFQVQGFNRHHLRVVEGERSYVRYGTSYTKLCENLMRTRRIEIGKQKKEIFCLLEIGIEIG